MRTWPVRTTPLPDECLSSWLTRSALALGTDTSSLVGSLKVSWRPWTIDLDRCGPRENSKLIIDRAGVDYPAIAEMTLLPIAERIAGSGIGAMDRWPWILTLGIRGSSRQFGTQYCPMCLRDDSKPYFRRSWRFAWHVVCSRHSVRLLDTCLNCTAQVEPHRLRQSEKHVALCWQCNSDLGSVKIDRNKYQTPDIQSQLDHALANHKLTNLVSAQRNKFVYYSRLIASLRRSIAAPTAANPSFEYLGWIGRKLRGLKIRPVSLEMLRTEERYQLLKITHDVRTICESMEKVTWDKNIPSDLRRALEGVKPAQTGINDQSAKKQDKRGGLSVNKQLTLPRPRHDIDRIWRRLKFRAHARRDN